jgi:aldose 1-epimerase
MSIIEIQNKFWNINVNSKAQGALTKGQIFIDGKFVDFFREAKDVNIASECSSYNLIPFSNRVKNMQFEWDGKKYYLKPTPAVDADNAIHGAVIDFPFNVEKVTESSVHLTFNSKKWCGVNFPWHFKASVEYKVKHNHLTIHLGLKNTDTVKFPAGFGIHPYFLKTILGNLVTLQYNNPEYFELDNCIPITGFPVKTPSNIYFGKQGKALTDDIVLDNVFYNKTPLNAVFDYKKFKIKVTADAIFKYSIIYTPPAPENTFAFEPVTNNNDGFNLQNNRIDAGVFVIEPGKEISGKIKYSIN